MDPKSQPRFSTPLANLGELCCTVSSESLGGHLSFSPPAVPLLYVACARFYRRRSSLDTSSLLTRSGATCSARSRVEHHHSQLKYADFSRCARLISPNEYALYNSCCQHCIIDLNSLLHTSLAIHVLILIIEVHVQAQEIYVRRFCRSCHY